MPDLVSDTVSDAASDADVYGLLRLGGIDVALPLSALREVVPRPATLTDLPVVAPGLVGAMGLRSLVLPVVDLRPLLERPDDVLPDQVVVVVAYGGRVVGLVADEVRGVTRVPHDDRLPLSAADGRLLVTHAFQHEDGATPISILDAEVLLSLPGVPTVAEPAAGELVVDTVAATGLAGSRSITLVRCGPQVLALEVGDIHTTIPLAGVDPSLLTGGACVGQTVYSGREVAVVDPLTLLGLPPLPEEDLGAGVVLEVGRGLVVLAVSELVELRGTGAGILPVPAYGALRPELLLGMVELDEAACLVLDGAALRSDAQLLSLAAVNTDVHPAAGAVGTGPAVAGEVASGRGPSYVTFTAGISLASPLTQVSEILPFPQALTPTAADQVLGLTVHRGRVVPVVCLSTLLGHPPLSRAASSCLLLVEVDDEPLAFAVDALGGIEALTWTDPASTERPLLVDVARAAHDAPLVQVAGSDKLVPDLDLPAIARSVRGSTQEGEMLRETSSGSPELLSGSDREPMVAA